VDLRVGTAELTALLLASARVGAWLTLAPPFAGRTIATPVKALLSIAIALPLVPKVLPHVPTVDSAQWMVSLAEQVVVGAALGFLTSLVFAAVQAAGSLIDLFGGFSLAFAFDPFAMSGNNGVATFGRFYNLLATTLLFATDGHELMLRGFTTSFRTLPVDGTLSLATLRDLLTAGIGQMFLAALQIAGPLIGVLFCADIALGLLNRVAPALNVLSLAFPAKVMLTLSAAGLAIAVLPRTMGGLIERAVHAIVQAAGG
jgi:flagellar biosynthesis protein FliR